MIRIAHFSDLHYGPKNLIETDRCFGAAIDRAIALEADAAVISGDATEHALDLHAPAAERPLAQVRRLADHCPVLMLQGTFSHVPPGTLAGVRLLGGKPMSLSICFCNARLARLNTTTRACNTRAYNADFNDGFSTASLRLCKNSIGAALASAGYRVNSGADDGALQAGRTQRDVHPGRACRADPAGHLRVCTRPPR